MEREPKGSGKRNERRRWDWKTDAHTAVQHVSYHPLSASSQALPFPAPLSLPHLFLVPLIIFAHHLTTQRGSRVEGSAASLLRGHCFCCSSSNRGIGTTFFIFLSPRVSSQIWTMTVELFVHFSSRLLRVLPQE